MTMAAMVAAQPAAAVARQPARGPAAAATAQPEGPRSAAASLAGRAFIKQRLIKLGAAPLAAEEAVRRLTSDDIDVLLASPKMLQAAGNMDVGVEVVLGTVLIIAVIVGLAVAGASVVVISGV